MAELRERLREAEETLDAIRNGEVDAVVVGGPAGQQVYTLENADRPYRALVEQMQEGALTLAGDGTVLYCNERFATLVGTPREAIAGTMFGRFVRAEDAGAFARMFAHGASVRASGEFLLLGGGGATVPVNVSLIDLSGADDGPRLICGVVTDLTENRRRSQQLASEIEERRRAEDSLRLALDAAGMGSWDLDLATETARRSPRHDEIFGHVAPVERRGLADAFAQIVPDDRSRVADAFARARITGALDFEARIRRADDGAIRWVHVKGQTYFEAGQPVRIAGVTADVTEGRKIEQQLRQAQKMEAVGQLTGGIAHDFNNLLMIIGGSLDMLSRLITLDPRTTRLFEAARAGVARGARLNQQLLAFSRRQDLRAEAVCVNELVPAFQHLVARAVGEAVALRVERQDTVWYCRTDPHQLETAILNLAINARDAMPQGGVLTLATANATVTEAEAARWGGIGGDYVVVQVEDTGTGMPPEVAARVFEPFFTTKEVGKGTGLGLSQVYGFARQSDGFVSIASEPDRGTAVAIHLPRSAVGPRTAPDPDPAADTSEPGQGIVLVVEDDPAVREITTGLLVELGYVVCQADGARAALAIVEEGGPLDLVFSDVIMPDGMSGVDLAHAVRRVRPGLPVLLTSGYTADRMGPAEDARDTPVLRKPYTQIELSAAVRGAMAQPVETAPQRVGGA